MRNKEIGQLINRCKGELEVVKKYIKAKPLAVLTRHLTLYALIEAYGTTELSIKTLFFAALSKSGTTQLQNYLNENIKNHPFDIRYDNICKFLKKYIDDDWKIKFKRRIDAKSDSARIKSSLKTLHDTRNEFAHGGNPTISFNEIRECFNDSIKLIRTLDVITK